MNRVEMIKDYATRKAIEELNKVANEQREYYVLYNKIALLANEIKEIIEVGKSCIESGIIINGYRRLNNIYKDSSCDFYTDGIKHRVGFYGGKIINGDFRGIRPIRGVGIINSGACGNTNLFVDENGYACGVDNTTGKVTQPRNKDMQRFLKEFDDFKRRFYTYVDSIVC